jgi:hypothetical protein
MFWRNAVQWQDRVPRAAALIDHFQARESAGDAEMVTWELRQVVFRKRPG